MNKSKTLYHTAVVLSVTAIILLTMMACSEQQPAIEKPVEKEKSTETPKQAGTPKESAKIMAPIIINEPIYDTMVDGPFLVKGDTNDADGMIYYTFDDGHNVLASGSIEAKESADGRKTFEFALAFEKPTSPYGILAMYSENPDGGNANPLFDTRVQFPMEFLAD